ncbi:hypothetical protein IFM89_008664 [Coptis chinensis]|uniref:Uncharacterized protein n=1 Tax=Coptis chinensis TaxID=261450 RepID=A0A835GYK2_9MAGN|nr:hypothetical protein IFM89_008664 [Coptis chinensis]
MKIVVVGPFVILVMETKCSNVSKATSMIRRLGDYSCFVVPSISLAGGMWLIWESFVTVEVLNLDSWFIHCKIELMLNGINESFVLSCVYGNPNFSVWHIQWSVFSLLKPQNDVKWLVMGDFNEVLNLAEKQGGRPFNYLKAMPFRDMVDGCELIDLGFMGNTFTWKNKQKGCRRILERIDRSLANAAWMLRFVNTKVYHEMATSSDHKFLIIKVDNVHVRLSRPFRFEAMWLQDSGCSEQVRLAFNVDTVGSPSFTLYNKLKHCQQNLQWWNKHIFCQLENRFKDIQQELQGVQDSIIASADPSDELIVEKQRLMQEHNVLLVQQATHWGQKSCSEWYKFGDLNTKFFHTMVKCR